LYVAKLISNINTPSSSLAKKTELAKSLLTASWFCFGGWFRDKDEKIDANKAFRKSST